jgi:hypothetical protein
MPQGGQVEGQQAHWIWENLEPGPQDDFSIVLLLPERWDELQAARAAVKTTPSDGQAWLKLCATYHTLSFGETTHPLLAVQACQEAARLLPGDAAPHYGLAVLYLSVLSQNPSPEALQPVLDELKIGQELEAVYPPSEVFFYNTAWYSSTSEYITDMVSGIFNDATATAEWASETGEAEATLIPQTSATTAPSQKPTLAATSVPSLAPQPLPTVTISAAATTAPVPQGSYTGRVLPIVAAGIVLISVMGYLVLKRKG